MKTMRVLAAGMMLAASATVWAQQGRAASGIYAAAEGGVVNYALTEKEAPDVPYSDATNAGAFRLALGYRLTPNLAFEAGYLHMGEFRRDIADGPNRHWSAKASADAFDLSVRYQLAGTLPGLFFKAGYLHSKVSLRTHLREQGIYESYEQSLRSSDTGSGYLLGVGYEFDLSDQVSAGAGYTRLQRLGGALDAGVSLDANLFTAGVKYHF